MFSIRVMFAKQPASAFCQHFTMPFLGKYVEQAGRHTIQIREGTMSHAALYIDTAIQRPEYAHLAGYYDREAEWYFKRICAEPDFVRFQPTCDIPFTCTMSACREEEFGIRPLFVDGSWPGSAKQLPDRHPPPAPVIPQPSPPPPPPLPFAARRVTRSIAATVRSRTRARDCLFTGSQKIPRLTAHFFFVFSSQLST